MFLRLLLMLTVIPLLEIYFLFQISDSIGFSNTLLIVIGTGLLGAWLLRKQGHSILMEIQSQTQQNKIPSDAIAKGFMTFVGGLLLLTPGVLTDLLGISLIFPFTQGFWKKYFTNQWKNGLASGSVKFYSGNPFQQGPFQNRPPEDDVFRENRPNNNVIDIKAKSKTVTKEEE